MIVQPGRRDLLEVAAEVFTVDPTASLGDVAAAAGIGRTTLHARYPKRHDLLLAVGRDAVRRIGDGITAVGLPAADATPDAHRDALRRLVETLIPLGVHTYFLLRQPALHDDTELKAAISELDESIENHVRHAQHAGVVRATLAPWWVVATLNAVVYSAWEGIAVGRLAALDAPELVLETFMRGVGVATDSS